MSETHRVDVRVVSPTSARRSIFNYDDITPNDFFGEKKGSNGVHPHAAIVTAWNTVGLIVPISDGLVPVIEFRNFMWFGSLEDV